MKSLNRKLVRDIFHLKGLLLAITSIIAVGVMCFTSMQSAYHNLLSAKQEYYRQCRMAEFWADIKKVPVAELASVAQLPAVVELRSRIQFAATVDLEDSHEPLNGLVISMPDRREPVLNDIVLVRGDYFTDRRMNEVIVNASFAEQHRIAPGDWIHLILNNRRQELFVVGTAISSEFTYLLGPGTIVPDPQRFGVFYIKRTFAEDVFDFQGAANQVVGRLSAATTQSLEETLLRIESLLQPFGVFTTTPLRRQASNQFLSAEIDGLGAFATVVPMIFLVVAALVLNVLITRLVRQQRVTIGTLKALGYSDRHLFFHFLQFGLVVGAAGGLVGGLLGYWVSALMTSIYRFYFDFPDLQSGFYWHIHAIGMSVSVLCAMLGSLHGARSVLLLQPAEAMRPAAPRRGGVIWLERIRFVWRRLTAGWRMTLRSVSRNHVRTGAAVFGSTMGAGLLVTGFMLVEGQNFFLDFQFHRVVRSDIDLTFKDSRGRDALDEVRRLPGVDRAEPVLNVACTFVNGPYRRKGAVTGIAADASLTIPRDRLGHRLNVPTSGLIMSQSLAELLHVQPGDAVTIIPVQGERRPVPIRIAQIADSFMGLTVYADIRYLSRTIGEEYALSGAQLLTDGDAGHLQQLYRRLHQTPQIQSITSRTALIENINKALLESQWIFIGMLALFAGVIFFGTIVNTSMVNLAERQREVATLRALGYGTWRIGGIFFRENMLTTMIGSLLGLPIGYWLTVLTATSYENDLIRFPVVSAHWIWVTTFLLALLFALLAQAVVQRSIHRMDCLEALKVKE